MRLAWRTQSFESVSLLYFNVQRDLRPNSIRSCYASVGLESHRVAHGCT